MVPDNQYLAWQFTSFHRNWQSDQPNDVLQGETAKINSLEFRDARGSFSMQAVIGLFCQAVFRQNISRRWPLSGPSGFDIFVDTPIPVEWLGQPGLYLQTATNLAGPWLDDWVTDATNWTSGVEITNGLMSVTHWPVSGTATFFKLVGE